MFLNFEGTWININCFSQIFVRPTGMDTKQYGIYGTWSDEENNSMFPEMELSSRVFNSRELAQKYLDKIMTKIKE